MKTLDQVIKTYKSATWDGRDLSRLAIFVPAEQFDKIGLLPLKEGATHKPIKFSRQNMLRRLKRDVAFGFVKALGRRGISAEMMYEVVKMWNWILEEGLENFDEYTQYGLPLFKATAIKYGFDNPIGTDTGSEFKYSVEGG